MALFVRIPAPPGASEAHPEFPIGAERYLNIIDTASTEAQQRLAASGFAGLPRGVAAALCEACERGVATGGAPTFVDVGAGGGAYSLLCRAVFRDAATVVAFEPDRQAFGWLSAIDRANRLGVVAERREVADAGGEGAHAPRVALDDYLGEAALAPTVIRFASGVDVPRAMRGARRSLAAAVALFIETPALAGDEIAEALAGYHVYRLGESGELEVRADIDWQQRAGWLLLRQPMTEAHAARVRAWAAALAECTPDESLPRKSSPGRKGRKVAAPAASKPVADPPPERVARPAIASETAPKPVVSPRRAAAPARAARGARLTRKLRKLLRDPRGFFADARWPGAGVFRWLLGGARRRR